MSIDSELNIWLVFIYFILLSISIGLSKLHLRKVTRLITPRKESQNTIT